MGDHMATGAARPRDVRCDVVLDPALADRIAAKLTQTW
jgi:hypothetical protein